MKRFFFFLLGYTVFSFSEKDRVTVLNFLLKNGLVNRMERGEGGNTRLFVLTRDRGLLNKLPCTPIGERGLPFLLKRAIRRPGLCVGALLGLLLFVLSSLVVWRVEVIGNDTLGDGEIVSFLEEVGVGVGAFAPRIDGTKAKNALLLRYPELSFVSLYVRGTTVSVEVRESEGKPPVSETETGLANQVAAFDAIIERISVKAGRETVSVGETVKKGDLLISGLYESATGIRAVYAKGEVLGRIGKKIEINQPYTVQEKILDEEKNIAFSLLFFGKEINLFNFAGNYGEEYDIIKRKEQIVLFGAVRLPIYLQYETARSYTLTERRLSESEAVMAAHRTMQAAVATAFANGMVVYKNLNGTLGDEGYTLECYVEAVMDISKPLAFTVEDIKQ